MTDVDYGALLASFAEITGVDDEKSMRCLEATDWQLEAAVQLFFAGGVEVKPVSPISVPGRSAAALVSDVPAHVDEDFSGAAGSGEAPVRAPLPVKTEALYQENPGYRAQLEAEESAKAAKVDAFRNFQDEMQDRFRMQNSGEGQSPADGAGPSVSEPRDKLALLFRPPFDILFKGTFDQAKAAGLKDGKWLLVNVQSHTEFDCHVIYEDTEEGRKVCAYYKLSYERKPVTLVIDPQTGQKVKAWEGMIDASRFLEDALSFLDRGPLERRFTPLPKKPRDVHEGDRGRSAAPAELAEEEQLRLAIQASMGHDSHNASGGPQAMEDASEVGASEGVGEVEELAGEPAANDPMACRVAIRFPTGQRGQRRFLKTDPAKILHTFCCQKVPEAAGGRKFKLVAGGLGPNPLPLDSIATLEELGVSGSMLSMTWL